MIVIQMNNVSIVRAIAFKFKMKTERSYILAQLQLFFRFKQINQEQTNINSFNREKKIELVELVYVEIIDFKICLHSKF